MRGEGQKLSLWLASTSRGATPADAVKKQACETARGLPRINGPGILARLRYSACPTSRQRLARLGQDARDYCSDQGGSSGVVGGPRSEEPPSR